jgi:hypothetical protein
MDRQGGLAGRHADPHIGDVMTLDLMTFVLFVLLIFSGFGVGWGAAGPWTGPRVGYGILGLCCLVAFLGHLFGKF